MPGQTIDLQPPPPEPIVSRPLKTGQDFVLVLHKHRYVYRGWDKEDYQPGDEAELHVEGEALGKELEFVIERAEEGAGSFAEVARVKAQIESGGKRATAKFKFPKPDPKGHVTKVEWKRARARNACQDCGLAATRASIALAASSGRSSCCPSRRASSTATSTRSGARAIARR